MCIRDRTEINKLENYRSAIQQYHKEQVMKNYVDAQLEKLDLQVDTLALEVRTLVQGQGVGSLNNLEKQLTNAINARQNYLRQKYPDDQTLSSLYDEESRQLKKIESWTTTYDAKEECIVSFYTDGYESVSYTRLDVYKRQVQGGTHEPDDRPAGGQRLHHRPAPVLL